MKMRKDIFLMYLALSVLIIIFATFFKFGPIKNSLRKINPTPISTTDPYRKPIATVTTKNNTITITGTVPPGWMFEGTFPIKLLDKHSYTVYPITAKEKTPGSWSSGKPVEFTVSKTIPNLKIFVSVSLEKSNPSGLIENNESFWIPIDRNVINPNYKCPSNGWIDCMPKVVSPGEKDTSDYSCSKDAIAWYKKNCPNFQGVAY